MGPKAVCRTSLTPCFPRVRSSWSATSDADQVLCGACAKRATGWVPRLKVNLPGLLRPLCLPRTFWALLSAFAMTRPISCCQPRLTLAPSFAGPLSRFRQSLVGAGRLASFAIPLVCWCLTNPVHRLVEMPLIFHRPQSRRLPIATLRVSRDDGCHVGETIARRLTGRYLSFARKVPLFN
jgi:hypothetical protein